GRELRLAIDVGNVDAPALRLGVGAVADNHLELARLAGGGVEIGRVLPLRDAVRDDAVVEAPGDLGLGAGRAAADVDAERLLATLVEGDLGRVRREARYAQRRQRDRLRRRDVRHLRRLRCGLLRRGGLLDWSLGLRLLGLGLRHGRRRLLLLGGRRRPGLRAL